MIVKNKSRTDTLLNISKRLMNTFVFLFDLNSVVFWYQNRKNISKSFAYQKKWRKIHF